MFLQEATFNLQVGSKHLIKNSELSINKDAIYGLVGPNGCGKTSLLNYISSNYLSVYIEQLLNDDILSIEDVVLYGNKHLMQLQNFLTEAYKSGDDNLIGDALSNLHNEYDIDREHALIRRLLKGLGFNNYHLPINSLSGGQQMKINLAKALYMMADRHIMKSHILLLDEPTNHLDISNVVFLTQYLKKEFKGTLIIASHDRYILDDICTNIINIRDNKLYYYKGNYSKYTYQLNFEITNNNKQYDKIQNKIKEMRKKGTPKDKVDEYIKENSHIKKIVNYGKKLRFYNETNWKLMSKHPCIMHINNISFCYKLSDNKLYDNNLDDNNLDNKLYDNKLLDNNNNMDNKLSDNKLLDNNLDNNKLLDNNLDEGKLIFENVNLIINDYSTRISIVGPNGCGKSTFLNVLAGKLEQNTGSVDIMNKIQLSHFDQHSSDHLKAVTPFNCIKEANSKLSDQEIHKYLGDLGLLSMYHKVNFESLSGGQKSRVALAKLMVTEPDFLLLDEVTNHLDMETCTALIDAINNFKGPIIMVSHNLDFIVSTNCKVYELTTKGLIETTIDDYRDKVWESLNQ